MALLDAIKQGPAFPDVFWSAGDQSFLRMHRRLASEHPGAIEESVSIIGNLNYNLLMHRRLFLPASCILVCRPLLDLLTDSNSGYHIFLQDGSIVPTFRESADSFADIAKQTIDGGNYVEDISSGELTNYARMLDQIGSSACHTHDSNNQQLMNDLANDELMEPTYWTDDIETRFPTSLAADLVNSVNEQMRDQGRHNFRPTEFWNFAKVLDGQAPELATAIRIESVIRSHGTMASNFNLPLVVPAPYAQPVGRIYGTGSPYRLAGDTVELPPNIRTETEISDAKAAIHQLAALLTERHVYEIRRTAPFRSYLRALEEADRVERDHVAETAETTRRSSTKAKDTLEMTAAEIVEEAFFTYRSELNTMVGAAVEGFLPQIRHLQWALTATRAARPATATSVGSITSVEPIAGLTRAGTSVFAMMIDKFLGRRYARATIRAQRATAAARLAREGHVKIEFFGPLDDRRWPWFYELPKQQ